MKKISIFNIALLFFFCVVQDMKAQNVYSLSEFNQNELNRPNIKQTPNINFKNYKSINNKFDYSLSIIDTTFEKKANKSPKEKKEDLYKKINSMNIEYTKFAQKHYRGVYNDIDENFDLLTKYLADVTAKFKKDSAVKADIEFKKSINKILNMSASSLKRVKGYKDSLMLQLGNSAILDSVNKNEKLVFNIQSSLDSVQNNLDLVDGKLNLEKSKSQSAIETLPTLIATSAFFVPTVNLIGNYVKKENGLAVNIQIFKGGSGIDSTAYNNLRRLLVPQASSFGISLGLNKSIGIFSDKFTKNYSASAFSNLHILFKDMPNYEKSKETPSINTAMIQGAFGTEIAPIAGINDVLNIYGGWNFIWIMNQRDNLNKYFGTEKHDFINYWNFGIKLNVPLTNESTSKIFLDVNFIFLNDNLRNLYNTRDAAIPIIAVGLKRNIVSL